MLSEWISSGAGARQRGGRRREGGEMDGAQPRVEPSAADSPPRLFGNSKVSPECTSLQHRSRLDVWAARCLLCAKPGGRTVKTRKGNPMLCVIICENDECLHMWRGRKKNRSGRQRQTCTFKPTALAGSGPLTSSVVTLIMHRIIAFAPFDTDQEKWKQFCANQIETTCC